MPKDFTNDAPFDLDRGRSEWIYSGTTELRILARSRHRIVVDHEGTRYHLNRRRLERDGVDHVGGRTFSVTSYYQEQTA